MIKKLSVLLIELLLIFILVGTVYCNCVNSANVMNYTEVNETVEYNTIIDDKPVVNESQKIVNVENRSYDNVSVKNETISNITTEEHHQKWVKNETQYLHGDDNYKGSEIDKVVLANGTVIRYGDEKNLAGCMPNPIRKYVNATLYLKNGTVRDIVIHNEGNKAYQNYGLRQTVPVYEDEVIVTENIVNKITTVINHITEVLYDIIDVPTPDPVDPVNNTTDPVVNNTTDPVVNNTTDPVVNNTTDPVVNNTTDESVFEAIVMEKTGLAVQLIALVCLILVLLSIIICGKK